MYKLRLTPRGRNYIRVRARIDLLELDTSHFRMHARIDDQRLREVVPASTSYVMVAEQLGLDPTDANAARVQRRIAILGLSTAHFPRTRDNSEHRARWSDDDLRAAVATSQSYAATLRALGLIPAGGNYDRLQRRISELGIDTSHFMGQGWNRGGKFRPRPARPLEEILVHGSSMKSYHLKQRLLDAGLKTAACERCGWAERAADGRVPVELDHVNGDKADNRIENLRILCPNCHALQPTHRGLNRKRGRSRCGERDSNPHE